MTSTMYQTRIRRGFGNPPSGVQRRAHQDRTTTLERLLLMVTAIIIPLEGYLPFLRQYLPSFDGMSVPYLMFAILACYALFGRPKALARTLHHPVFLAAFALILLGFVIEFTHDLARYTHLTRMASMFVAAMVVASLCRDRRALLACISGYLISGVVVGILFFFTSYGTLRTATSTDFQEASQVRAEVFTDIEGNLNELAFSTAQAAALALALALTARSPLRRKLFFGLALFCGIATFLPMSRGGMVIVGASCSAVMYMYGVRNVRVILVATALAVGGLILVPGAVLSRFSLSMETPSGKMEARGRIYKAAIDHLPDYIILGVGAGNFAGPWGMQSQYFDRGFKEKRGGVKGAHNAFIQVTIFWGLPALVMLIVLVYQAYRCLPRGGGRDILVICAYGLAFSLLLRMMFTHGLAEKQYAVGLGFLVGGYLWVWSKRLLPPLGRMQPLRHPVVNHAP
jgi:hypothetical protein